MTEDPRERLPLRMDIFIGQLAAIAIIVGAALLIFAICGGQP